MTPREQKKHRTRSTLASAAIEMFGERGYDEVTVAEIATAAGVSRRTAFRYFPTKDDLIMEHPNQWMQVFISSLDANQHLCASQRLREGSYAVAAHIEADPEPVIQLFSLAFAHPTLSASYARNSQAWIERVAKDLSSATTTDDSPLAITVLAAAYMGMVNSVCLIWAQDGGSMIELLDAGFAALQAGLTSLD